MFQNASTLPWRPSENCPLQGTRKLILVPEPFQIRTSFVVHLRFSWYKFETEDFHNCFTGPCFLKNTTKILDGPEKTFYFGKVLP